MAFLSTHGYETVFVRDVVGRYESARPVPSTWVALTFDAGYEDFDRNVYPVLEQHRLKATLFVIVAGVGMEGGVTWDQLRQMRRSGLVEIGSHSYDHVADQCLSAAQAREDEAKAKAALEADLGAEITTYAYPYGAYSERAARMLQALGYRGAVGIVYRLERVQGGRRLQPAPGLRLAVLRAAADVPLHAVGLLRADAGAVPARAEHQGPARRQVD